MKEIKYTMRTDFCDELMIHKHQDETLKYRVFEKDKCKITHISIMDENNVLNKEVGEYITIDFDTLEEEQSRRNIISCLQDCLSMIYTKPFEKALIVGLGNSNIVSDALGPKTCENILVTSHLFQQELHNQLNGCRNVAVLTPKVMGQSGMESACVISAITDYFRPDVVFLIDALATSSISRINSAIQMNTVGIKPGSGVGNHRKEITSDYLKCDVIAIGVATVTSLAAMMKDALGNKEDWYAFVENDVNLDMVVTPKNMDDVLFDLCDILAEGINHFIHPSFENL